MGQPLSGECMVWLNTHDIIFHGEERFWIGENFKNIFDWRGLLKSSFYAE